MMSVFAFIGILVCVWFVSDLLSGNSSLRREIPRDNSLPSTKKVSPPLGIVREDGIYTVLIKSTEDFAFEYIFISVFFIKDYMSINWIEVDEPIDVDSAFLNEMFELHEEVSCYIEFEEETITRATEKFAKFLQKGNSVEARFFDDSTFEGYKHVTLKSYQINQIFINVDVHRMHFDRWQPENSRFKNERYVDNRLLKFHQFKKKKIDDDKYNKNLQNMNEYITQDMIAGWALESKKNEKINDLRTTIMTAIFIDSMRKNKENKELKKIFIPERMYEGVDIVMQKIRSDLGMKAKGNFALEGKDLKFPKGYQLDKKFLETVLPMWNNKPLR